MAKVIGFTIEIQGTKAAIENATDLKLAIKEINKQLKDPDLSGKQYDKLEKTLIDLKARQKEVNAQTQIAIKQRQSELKVTGDSVGAYRKLASQLSVARARMKDLAAAGKENTAEFRQASAQVRKLDNELKRIDKSAGQFQRNVGNYSKALKTGFGSIAKTLSFAGVALGVQELTRAISSSITVFADFERQIKFLGAVSGATTEELAALEEQAKELGATTQFSASQVAELQIEYSKLGFTATEVLAATADTLDLASVAQSELGETAQVVGATLRAFNLDAEQTGRIADVAAKAFSSSALDLSKFQTAMASVAPVAAGFGVSIEETSALLGVLVDAGLDASTAGTGLRNVLLDSASAGLTYNEALEQVTNATDSNLEALDLFGKRGATVGKVLADNRERVDELSVSLQQSAGFAKEAGDAITDDLRGDFDGFNSAVESLQITFTKFFENTARRITQLGTRIVRSIGPALQFISNLLAPVREAFNKLFESIGGGEVVSNRLSAVFEFLGNTLGLVVDLFAFGIDTIATFIKQIRSVTESNTILGQVFRALSDRVTGFISDLSKIPAFLGGIVNAFKQLRSNIANLDFSKSIGESFKEGFNRIENARSAAAEKAEKNQKTREEKQIERDKLLAKEKADREAESARKIADQKADQQKKLNDKLLKDQEKAAEKAEAARIAALKKERSDFAKQLEQVTFIRDATAKILTDAGGELTDIAFEFVEKGAGIQIIADSLEERSKDVLTRIKKATKDFSEDIESEGPKGLELIFGTTDPRAISENAGEFLNNSVLPVLSAFQQRAFEESSKAIDSQIETQEQSIAALNEEISNASGIRKQILQKRLADEQKILDSSNAEKEKLVEEQAKKEKRINVLQSIIQTALAVSRALANPPGPPFSIPQAIAAGVFGAAQTATIIAQPLADSGSVMPVELPNSSGRVTYVQNIPATQKGDKVLVAATPGEVFLNHRHQQLLGGSSTFKTIGVPGFAAGGVIGAPISAPILAQRTGVDNSELIQLIKEVDSKSDAINRRIDRIRTYVVSEDVSSDLAEGELIKTQATFE